ncbi:toll/interleukin-1 receptor domain-containing protein [Uliginosibacterium sp. H1]|uniref:toll/interleukin-1 receptor domain-containing protein n=1 Tax=Uliginosibacterium sp. H1 TaxID=3114757 RepID=UPI002E18C003|nr:toll/interleukin-1 receptor domain-containing protein [Uliginosibacterium sp. H1]
MPGKIFINYRREDARWPAARLAEALAFAIGDDRVAPDLSPGVGHTALHRHLADCAVMLVLIGPRWLAGRNGYGLRRVDDPHDPVRQEILAGLMHRLHVIPVLLDGTPMPSRFELPVPLKPLADLQPVELSGARFDMELQYLVTAIGREPRLAQDPGYAPLIESARSTRHWPVVAFALVAAVAAVLIGAERAADRSSLAERLIEQFPPAAGNPPAKPRDVSGAWRGAGDSRAMVMRAHQAHQAIPSIAHPDQPARDDRTDMRGSLMRANLAVPVRLVRKEG